ncbi:MAG: hypothetical protein RBR78_10745 [Flavobacteriaceae bacterium]|jgi:hypothetical protein|nr:hypothetical protein [Flavobacteriaceae bacterium]
MKNIFLKLIMFIVLSANAQNLSLELRDPLNLQAGAYYKDTNNVFDNFVGTWLYTNGNTSFKIVLAKQPDVYVSNGGYYEDLIIGEYQYIENGVEKINTLSNIGLNLGRGHKIKGNNIHRDCYFMPVGDCTEGETRLVLGLKDITGKHFATVVLKRRKINGQHTLKAWVVFDYSGYDDPPPSPTLPWQQEYVMFKQP